MSKTTERNKLAKDYVHSKLSVAKIKKEEDFIEFKDSLTCDLLTDLIEVNSKGFRGIVITALVGLHLNKNYDPLNNFYDCKPRSIFEGGIWYALQDNGIPSGKSDPLNVAKNTNRINDDWAEGKRPQRSARAVVLYLRSVMEANQEDRDGLIDYFFFRLWRYAQTITSFRITEIVVSDYSRQSIGNKLVDFTLKYPESGNLPQYFAGLLLTQLFFDSRVKVLGGDESVFSTNTTSKKPADIWLELDENLTNLYEITVKPITLKRLDDILDSLGASGHLKSLVTFVCRIDLDVDELDIIEVICPHFNGQLSG